MSNEQQQIIIYDEVDGKIAIEVNLVADTVWLTQAQMQALFDKNKRTISEHINNVFKEGELKRKGTVRKFRTVQQEGQRQVERELDHFNLDVIISVGYRVKSHRGTQFRIWATNVLRNYLVKGYSINQKRLAESEDRYKELKNAIQLVAKTGAVKELSSVEAKGILKVLEEYAFALDMLDKYDHNKLKIQAEEEKVLWKLPYSDAIEQIAIWRKVQNAGKLFGNEKDESFKSSLGTIYQTFDERDLYPSIEEKAAHLLYFIVKNHSFTDGNKRIAAGLFIYFLDRNNKLYCMNGKKIIGDNALVAITIMIAESNPKEKETMIKLIVNLIQDNEG